MPYLELSKSKLKKEGRYREQNPTIEGWMLPEELRWLNRMASNYNLVLEVGSWKGRSTHALLTSGAKRVIVVDTFEASPSMSNSSIKEAKFHNIFSDFILNVGRFPNLSVLRMDSYEASQLFRNGSIEMIFLDGDHEYHQFIRDLFCWTPKCTHLLCGHDLEEGGVKKALEDLNIKYRKGVGTLWYTKLRNTSTR